MFIHAGSRRVSGSGISREGQMHYWNRKYFWIEMPDFWGSGVKLWIFLALKIVQLLWVQIQPHPLINKNHKNYHPVSQAFPNHFTFKWFLSTLLRYSIPFQHECLASIVLPTHNTTPLISIRKVLFRMNRSKSHNLRISDLHFFSSHIPS